MHKFVITSVLALLSLDLIAQDNIPSTDNVRSEVTIKVSKKTKRHRYFSDSAPVTMADGSVKSIADIKVGEHVKTCKGGKSMATQVKQIDVYNKPDFSLTAIYLRPVDGIANYDPKMIPALLLEATPNHRVQTNRGKKRLKKLSKNDILYHYEPATGIVSSWKVGAVKENARFVSKAYNLETEDGTYLVDNVMVAQ